VDNKGKKGKLLPFTVDQAVKRPSQQTDVRHKPDRNVNANIPGDFKDDTREIKHDREQKPLKGAYDHRLFDRQSANNKPSEARKHGGGAGNIGSLRDELNQDKIFARVKEEGDEPVDETPKIPEKPSLTLDQYYLQQGISIESLEKQLSKEEHKKKTGPVDAEWISKEKLTLMKTKEDTKDDEPDRKPAVTRSNDHKVQSAPEQELLGKDFYYEGFKSGLARDERRPVRDDK
jgi:hypothetical protein